VHARKWKLHAATQDTALQKLVRAKFRAANCLKGGSEFEDDDIDEGMILKRI
jgi:hypothetical protein